MSDEEKDTHSYTYTSLAGLLKHSQRQKLSWWSQECLSNACCPSLLSSCVVVLCPPPPPPTPRMSWCNDEISPGAKGLVNLTGWRTLIGL